MLFSMSVTVHVLLTHLITWRILPPGKYFRGDGFFQYRYISALLVIAFFVVRGLLYNLRNFNSRVNFTFASVYISKLIATQHEMKVKFSHCMTGLNKISHFDHPFCFKLWYFWLPFKSTRTYLLNTCITSMTTY